jgi:hypothetical protein
MQHATFPGSDATRGTGDGDQLCGRESFFFTLAHYSNASLKNSPIWNTASKYPSGVPGGHKDRSIPVWAGRFRLSQSP